jgi:hypothetical protein
MDSQSNLELLGGEPMSHHKKLMINGIEYGHVRITNDGQILSIWIMQPWGEGELLTSKYPEVRSEEE